MRILIIAEGRTGGTTLMEYIESSFPKYEILTEPYTNKKDWIENNDITDVGWYQKKDNVVVKEIFHDNYDFKNFIDSSDKVLCIYRKNWYEQTRSVLYAEYVKKFLHDYKINNITKVITNEMIFERYAHSRKVKKLFIDFIQNNNFVNVSYEDLYYGDGINIVKNYLNIKTNIIFPPTKRYLKNVDNEEYVPENSKDYDDDYLKFLEFNFFKLSEIVKSNSNIKRNLI